MHNISYCHWKSNAALDRSVSGENDLDLLVSRASVQGFIEVLAGLGFKQARSQSSRRIPGVLDFYGYDSGSDRIIHVHAHIQLILGHDATKNYHIPIEEAYLTSACQSGIFRVPSAEYELILLVIRLVLKHSTWDTCLLNQGRLSVSEQDELNFLLKRASRTKMGEIIKEHLPYIGLDHFDACLESLQFNRSVLARVQAGEKLQNDLKPTARLPQIVDSGLKIWRRFAWSFEAHILRKNDRKDMNNGGLLIAIVGGDGAGKTTTVDELTRWLGNEFDVYRFHMGKPDWSVLTIILRGILKIGRSLRFYPFMRAEIEYTKDINQIIFPGYPWLIRELCTARDRYLTYQNARRLSTNGRLVILDRFPLSQIQFMDGPQIEWLTSNLQSTRLVRYFSRLEKSFYQKIMLPDLLILLRVDPEIAVKRKTDETEDSVRARSSEIWNLNSSQVAAQIIDANRSREEVLSEVKRLIWSRL